MNTTLLRQSFAPGGYHTKANLAVVKEGVRLVKKELAAIKQNPEKGPYDVFDENDPYMQFMRTSAEYGYNSFADTPRWFDSAGNAVPEYQEPTVAAPVAIPVAPDEPEWTGTLTGLVEQAQFEQFAKTTGL